MTIKVGPMSGISRYRPVLENGRMRLNQHLVFSKSYSQSANYSFPVGMPSTPILPGDANYYHHFEHRARRHLKDVPTLTFKQVHQMAERDDISIQKILEEMIKLNQNFDKFFNFLEQQKESEASRAQQ